MGRKRKLPSSGQSSPSINSNCCLGNLNGASNPKKQRCLYANDQKSSTAATVTFKRQNTSNTRCHYCKQFLDEASQFHGDRPTAQEECVALTHPALSLVSDGSVLHDEADARPQQKVTDFSVYCPAGHLCPFDTGLIEENVELYFSGLLLPIYSAIDDAEAALEGAGIACRRMGPIDEWWLSGFDGGQRAIVGFSTEYGEYILARPHSEYRSLMESALEKIQLTKLVTECLLLSDSRKEEAVEYEELLERVAPISADSVLSHASFVIEQLRAMDREEGTELMRQPCIRTLLELSGLNEDDEDGDDDDVNEDADDQENDKGPRLSATMSRLDRPRRHHRRIVQTRPPPQASSADTKATVTPLVRSVFDSVFQHQLDAEVRAADFITSTKADMFLRLAKLNASALVQAGDCFEFLGQPIRRQIVKSGRPVSRLYYSAVQLGPRCQLKLGDFVLWRASWRDGRPTQWRAARITRLYSETVGSSAADARARFHASVFLHGEDTILGSTADPCELFATADECCSADLSTVVMKLDVARRTSGDRLLTASAAEMEANAAAGRLFYQKVYLPERGYFIDPPSPTLPVVANGNENGVSESDNQSELDSEEDDADEGDCQTCTTRRRAHRESVPRPGRRLLESENDSNSTSVRRYSEFYWRGQVYRLLSCCYLEPGTHKFAKVAKESAVSAAVNGDSPYPESVYTERYRKTAYVKGSNEATPPPYQIGRIVEIVKRGQSFPVRISLRMFYRPEDAAVESAVEQPLHLLYCSEEECSVVVKERVRGLCSVVHADELDGLYNSPEQFFLSGPDRFYYESQFDSADGRFHRVCVEQESVDLPAMRAEAARLAQVKPLHCLDVFSGCGGLSEGLHQAGAAITRWAIERDPDAAKAFALNHPDCAVLTDDCNRLLRLAMDGVSVTPDSRQLPIPQRGQVQLLCGGPPCQGYSGMNRFNAREASKLKNSLVASFLSYADYYRPDYFLLENVRNFAAYNKSCILQLTMRCLLAMGYQLGAAILQAGQFGVPQTRRRLIILAAAPGKNFADFPRAVHAFSPKACAGLALLVGERRFEPPTSPASGCFSGPLRPITVGDALSDLPAIESGGGAKLDQPVPYGCPPRTHYQLLMRGGRDSSRRLTDHVTKQLTPLVEARLALIPACPGADWRDLPNVELTLSDGSLARRLRYTHGDRGVCPCALPQSGNSKSRAKCDSQAKQLNTLIPWCLPHTGDRHNHWAGLYGRLDVEGFFSTTVTNPEPMGKQGRVVHPSQHRVVSVRECARSQGFPDAYRFAGDLVARHRQIGNAVPPPLARALGVQIVRALATPKATANHTTAASDVSSVHCNGFH